MTLLQRLFLLVVAGASVVHGGIYYVAPGGSDAAGDGSAARPWATLTHAAATIPDDGSTVIVRDGIYKGRVRLSRRFARRAVFRAEHPYRARLENSARDERVVAVFGAANFELAGFEITRPGPEADAAVVVQIQQSGGLPAEDIVLRDNIIHDSFNNDLVKVNNVARRILIEGNLLFNQQGHDEHIDANGVTDVTIRDNIFFNDFAGSGRVDGSDTGSFIVIKNSAALPENRRIRVQRNVFLNWEGSPGSYFVLVGEDGQPFHEAEDVLVENNLMLGNSPKPMRAPFGVKGARDVVFRHNTVVGNLPSNAFGMRLNREGQNPVNERIWFFANVWADPTGTMEDFSDGDRSETRDARLDNNLYWNGGRPLPSDGDVLNPAGDPRAIIGDPNLPLQDGLVLPRWTGERFRSGNRTIREEFERLVMLYGAPGPGSAVIGRADPAQAPEDDILGRPRDAAPDLGCFEVDEEPPRPVALTDAAVFRPLVAPGGLATLFGAKLSIVTASAAGGVLPRNLAGVEVLASGRPTPLWYVSPSQINFQMPYDAPAQTELIVRRAGFVAPNWPLRVEPTAPAIFSTGAGPAITHSGTARLVTPGDPARPGEYISLWLTGLGVLEQRLESGQPPERPLWAAAPVRVLFNGDPVEPRYAGVAIGFPGLNQIDVEVPRGLQGSVRIEVQAGGARSEPVPLNVAP